MGLFWTTQALADQVVVQRNVTVREAPLRASEPLDFPQVGTRLELLDDGAQQRGYYRVRLPDGREGWVYRNFVRRVADAAPLVAIGPATTDRMAVHYIDVDQGAAALLEFSCGAILIDAGGHGEAAGDHLLDYLDLFFDRRTDLDRRLAAVFVTHTHVDHNSNLRRVAGAFGIGGYVHNGRLNGSGRHNANWMVRHASEATPMIPALAVTDVGASGVTNEVIDPVDCPGTDPRIHVLAGGRTANPGWSATAFDNGNNHSLVIRVGFGESSLLFTGDLEEEGIEHLLAWVEDPRMIDVGVYEVGHHGSYNGTTDLLMAAMTPDIAVISMGPHTIHQSFTAWAHGHPRRSLVAMLDRQISRRRGAPVDVMVANGQRRFSEYPMTDAIYATGWDGDIVISATADGAMEVRLSPSP